MSNIMLMIASWGLFTGCFAVSNSLISSFFLVSLDSTGGLA